MTTPAQPHDPDNGALFDHIAAALEERGYVLLGDVLPPALSEALSRRSRELGGDEFRSAGVGRGGEHQVNRAVRTDDIRWLSAGHPAEAEYLQWMETLRIALNRRLFLGLFDYEAHFSRYAPGAYYRRHVDAFRGGSNRVLSTVFYLNPDWAAIDGGEFCLYEGDNRQPLETFSPGLGAMVIFLSERFPHEVLPAKRRRYSIAGWFRVNSSSGQFVDPAR